MGSSIIYFLLLYDQKFFKYYRNVALKIRVHILGSSYAFTLVKRIIVNFLHAFSQQFMESSMCWDMFGKVLVFCY